jgi:hypothetical protein
MSMDRKGKPILNLSTLSSWRNNKPQRSIQYINQYESFTDDETPDRSY